jgi:hypothetical protein
MNGREFDRGAQGQGDRNQRPNFGQPNSQQNGQQNGQQNNQQNGQNGQNNTMRAAPAPIAQPPQQPQVAPSFVAQAAPTPITRPKQADTSVSYVVGTVFLLLGILLACVLLIVLMMPTRWRRVNGTVEQSDGTRAKVGYTASGAHKAYLEFPNGVSKGQTVELVYLLESPGTYDHAHIRKSTLLTFAIPAICALLLFGTMLIKFA